MRLLKIAIISLCFTGCYSGQIEQLHERVSTLESKHDIDSPVLPPPDIDLEGISKLLPWPWNAVLPIGGGALIALGSRIFGNRKIKKKKKNA